MENIAENGVKVAPVSRKREIGIEVLRLLSMLLIVCQHFMNHGGFIKNAGGETVFLNLLNVLFSPTVNVFILISGYFSWRSSSFKKGKLLALYLQVAFYSILTAFFVGLFFDGVTVSNIKIFLPIISREYWFFTAYFLLLLLVPYINAMLGAISRGMHLGLAVATLAVGYLASHFDIQSVLSLNSGYSLIWFVLLYIVGAYLGRYKPKIPKLCALIAYLVTVAAQMAFKYADLSGLGDFGKLIRSTTDYNDPLTLIGAVCLVVLFLGIGDGSGRAGKAIGFISASTFGVYLLHEAPAVRAVLYTRIFHTEEYFGLPYSAVYVILFAVITFAVGIAVDLVRRLIVYGARLMWRRISAAVKQAKNMGEV